MSNLFIAGLIVELMGVMLLLVAVVQYYRERKANERELKGFGAAVGELPLIGYKRAFLLLGEEAFDGVSGVCSPYSCDSEAPPNTPGFHSYYELSSALNHEQVGTIYLEILAYGEVEHHRLGMTSQGQRVLQLIVGDCGACNERQADYWLELPDHLSDAPHLRNRLLCIQCSEFYRNPRSLKDLEARLQSYCGEGQTVQVTTLKPSSWGSSFVASTMERNKAVEGGDLGEDAA